MIAPIAVALAVGLLGWAYQALKPPPPKICGSPNGPPISSPRVKLSDGRHLAYRESGVPREEAKHKIIVIHGFGSSKDINLPAPQELIEEHRIYFVYFDRAGYGESDPHPERSVKSEAFDIQELADKLNVGSNFYVLGISMGGYPIWSCLKYIPHRLSGAALVVPFVNYWWPCLPSNLARESLGQLAPSDQWTFRVAHYAPWLFYWWMTQKWFPSLSILSGSTAIFSVKDLEIIKKLSEAPSVGQDKITQQGAHESLHRDIMAGYGKWEFDPLDVANPFPDNSGSVHIWQGYEDKIIPYKINRYLSEKLPWIHYHEVADGGHMLLFESNQYEAILKALLHEKVVTHLTGIWKAENASTSSLPIFITQLFVILSVNRLLTLAFRPLHIPRIAAEILGGILLGPSVIGYTDFAVKHLHPFGTLVTLENLANLGLVYFMFMVGLEVDLKPVLRAGRKAVTTAAAGIILPVPIGFALYHLLLSNFSPALSKDRPSEFGPLFWGLAIATTNFPDLAGLLADLKLLHTDIGRTALTSSVISDILCWILFVLIMATSGRGRLFTVTTTSAFVIFAFFMLRPSVKYLLRRFAKEENYSQRHVIFILTGVVVCGYITDACGSHSIFGAFMFGVILPKGELKRAVLEMIEDFVSELLIPLFFYCIGMRTDAHWIFRRGVDIGILLVVIAVAFSAKVVSTFLVAYFLNKMPPKDGLALGLLLNTKGLLALIMISSGRDILVR
ncbi:Alpha/Beta hydrolase [Trema orientale]|uniref:Alpha/Beta hydrolase n=1 Tax=Trema orientale TaxID=63057 RepID=A0A2P5FTZ8_TREOI|nr:Alpha/Beta hydrolase [Trema orientale]